MAEVLKSFCSTEIAQERRVSFDDHVLVVPIVSLRDYPTQVRRSLWISREELAFSMQQAIALENKERREKALRGLQEVDTETKRELHLLSTEDDEDDENECSMDSLDLAWSDGLDEESPGLDSMLEVRFQNPRMSSDDSRVMKVDEE